MTINVLITGMGQVIGIGIMKALKISNLDCRLLGTDCNPKSAGLYMVDKSFVLPDVFTQSQAYLEKMASICMEEKIHIILLGSEPEIKVFSRKARDFTRETGAIVMVSPAGAIEQATDKWKTHQFLTGHGFPVPATAIPSSEDLEAFAPNHDFPLIIKPRTGSASNGVQIIENHEQLLFFARTRKNIILQEYIEPDDEEYTVGVFLTAPGQSHGTIVLRRDLSGGVTFRAEVVQDDEISALCSEIAEISGLIGPCNIQLRRSRRGPVILEINPRFSSTVAIRAHFGFNEPAMAIERFVLKIPPSPPRIRCGTALRYWEEQYIE